MAEFLTQLYNGIPLYWWLFFAAVLIGNAIAIFVSIPDDGPRRDTTSAGQPWRKRGWGP